MHGLDRLIGFGVADTPFDATLFPLARKGVYPGSTVSLFWYGAGKVCVLAFFISPLTFIFCCYSRYVNPFNGNRQLQLYMLSEQ